MITELVEPFGPAIGYTNIFDDVEFNKILNNVLSIVDNNKNQIKQHLKSIKNKSISKGLIGGHKDITDAMKNDESFSNLIKEFASDYLIKIKNKNNNLIRFNQTRDLVDPSIFRDREEKISKFNIRIGEAWFVILKSGDFHALHNHYASDLDITDDIFKGFLSGAFYLDVPENLDFPQGSITWINGGNNVGLDNSSSWTVSPKSGDMFIWPAWLPHMVYPFSDDKERLMISFNLIGTKRTKPVVTIK